MDFKSKIVLIYGPTASGKSKFAIQLAKKINGEIINADSMQVYKELKILSARPSLKDYQDVHHHLYGFQSVKKKFSVGDWLKLANKKILDLKKKNKTAILVGGTGLYFKSLINGLVKIPNIPIRLRTEIRSLHKRLGSKKFFSRLTKLDPLVKNRIKYSDAQRSIRAYEVKFYTKKSIYDWFKSTKSIYKQKDFYKIYVDYPRNELLTSINLRSQQMIKNGAVLEVKKFIKLKVHHDKTANKAIGIGEIREYIKKKSIFMKLLKKYQ